MDNLKTNNSSVVSLLNNTPSRRLKTDASSHSKRRMSRKKRRALKAVQKVNFVPLQDTISSISNSFLKKTFGRLSSESAKLLTQSSASGISLFPNTPYLERLGSQHPGQYLSPKNQGSQSSLSDSRFRTISRSHSRGSKLKSRLFEEIVGDPSDIGHKRR